jgi:putative transposase
MSTAFKIINQNALYFLTLTIIDWIDLFTRDQNRRIVIDALDYCRKHKGLKLWAYVIMTNHIHLIASTEERSLSGILRDFKRHTAKQLLRSINTESESRRSWMIKAFSISIEKINHRELNHQIWFHDNHPIELESYKFTMQKLGYIHENPVRAGFVDDPSAWVYSSQRNYLGLPGILEIDLMEV